MAGSQKDSGTLLLQVLADGTTNETWSFAKVSHSYTRGSVGLLGSNRNCVYTDGNSKQHQVSGANCLQAVPWFFPSFVLEPVYSAAIDVVDQTSSSDISKGLEKLSYSLSLPTLSGAKQRVLDSLFRLKKASTVTVYYDSKTALPNLLVYQQAFDNDESRTIEVSVQFSGYSAESGFMIPHHIQRYVQRTLQVDINISAVTIQ